MSATTAPTSILPAAPPSASDEKVERKVTPATSLALKYMKSPHTRGRGRTLRCRLGFVGAITTSAAGVINAAVNVSTIGTTSEFASFAAIFDEFFVHSMRVEYVPFNQFIGPSNLDAAPFISWSSGLIVGAPLYHGAASYAAASDMVNNVDHKALNTGVPWTQEWVNNEKPDCGVSASATTSAPTPSQSWCLTSATSAALYTGFLQYRTALPFSAFTSAKTLGQTVVTFDVSFRAKA
jgi:hypothetical protein